MLAPLQIELRHSSHGIESAIAHWLSSDLAETIVHARRVVSLEFEAWPQTSRFELTQAFPHPAYSDTGASRLNFDQRRGGNALALVPDI